MSKTPYEIRLELLSMAQSILTENMFAERNRLENDWQTQRELVIIAAQQGHSWASVPAVPAFPELPTISSDDIIGLATKLNEFVSNKE